MHILGMKRRNKENSFYLFFKLINNAEKVFLHGIVICGNGMKYDYMNMEENLIYLGVMAPLL